MHDRTIQLALVRFVDILINVIFPAYPRRVVSLVCCCARQKSGIIAFAGYAGCWDGLRKCGRGFGRHLCRLGLGTVAVPGRHDVRAKTKA